jgi:hypothetical protein
VDLFSPAFTLGELGKELKWKCVGFDQVHAILPWFRLRPQLFEVEWLA